MLVEKLGVSDPWAPNVTVRTRTGLQNALLMSTPFSLAMWLVILRLLNLI